MKALAADWYRSCASSNFVDDDEKKEKPDEDEAFFWALCGVRARVCGGEAEWEGGGGGDDEAGQ